MCQIKHECVLFSIWIESKDTCDVAVIKKGIAELKKAIEKEEPKIDCPAESGNISLLVFRVIVCTK